MDHARAADALDRTIRTIGQVEVDGAQYAFQYCNVAIVAPSTGLPMRAEYTVVSNGRTYARGVTFDVDGQDIYANIGADRVNINGPEFADAVRKHLVVTIRTGAK
ncbi:hypothetical protein [Polyangium spumosum]|uniref:Uncharacterized protein n=1 Tax=Polyangium spumosum TaxID=889282 RepID=A0A6N7PYP8_9BACT|nr:hypothetical protein [Polyangium spumosum]MRG97133.1 hypothetical protein [Polyangium spumosum]